MTIGRKSEFSDWNDKLAVLHQHQLINEEIEAETKTSVKPGSARDLVIFMAAVVMVKPIAEYCIELIAYLITQWHALAAFLGL